MKVLVHNLEHGGVGITTTIMPMAEYIEKFVVGDYLEIEHDEIPNPKYVSAFNLKNSQITIDMAKAKELRKEELRNQRTPKLAELDIQFMRAVEQGDTATQQAVGAKKQALRDITSSPAFDTATTLDQLEAIVLPE